MLLPRKRRRSEKSIFNFLLIMLIFVMIVTFLIEISMLQEKEKKPRSISFEDFVYEERLVIYQEKKIESKGKEDPIKFVDAPIRPPKKKRKFTKTPSRDGILAVNQVLHEDINEAKNIGEKHPFKIDEAVAEARRIPVTYDSLVQNDLEAPIKAKFPEESGKTHADLQRKEESFGQKRDDFNSEVPNIPKGIKAVDSQVKNDLGAPIKADYPVEEPRNKPVDLQGKKEDNFEQKQDFDPEVTNVPKAEDSPVDNGLGVAVRGDLALHAPGNRPANLQEKKEEDFEQKRVDSDPEITNFPKVLKAGDSTVHNGLGVTVRGDLTLNAPGNRPANLQEKKEEDFEQKQEDSYPEITNFPKVQKTGQSQIKNESDVPSRAHFAHKVHGNKTGDPQKRKKEGLEPKREDPNVPQVLKTGDFPLKKKLGVPKDDFPVRSFGKNSAKLKEKKTENSEKEEMAKVLRPGDSPAKNELNVSKSDFSKITGIFGNKLTDLLEVNKEDLQKNQKDFETEAKFRNNSSVPHEMSAASLTSRNLNSDSNGTNTEGPEENQDGFIPEIVDPGQKSEEDIKIDENDMVEIKIDDFEEPKKEVEEITTEDLAFRMEFRPIELDQQEYDDPLHLKG